jgi:opacity protein-like surface antigen
MIKRLVVICCILLLPTIAVSATPDATTNYGDFWVGGQLGVVFTPNTNVTITSPLFPGLDANGTLKTNTAFSAGAIIGYNFCMPYRQPWERYFGVALDFQWNQFNQPEQDFLPRVGGNQFALSFLGRLQYPFMGSETFTRGRIVPFLMFGPAIVWTNSDYSNFFGAGNRTSTDFGIVAELGVEFFICPHLSIGPSFRYRHVWGPNHEVLGADINSRLDQFMIMGRLAWHF